MYEKKANWEEYNRKKEKINEIFKGRMEKKR